MWHVREKAFRQLRAFLTPAQLNGVMRCALKLYAALPDPGALEKNVVLVAYGGGKDSSYMLAFVRSIQLLLFQVYGSTFRMRLVTNRHAGMPRAVMENIHRTYTALGILEDPGCEPLLVDGNEVVPFRVDAVLSEASVQRNREDILMTGHRTQADARPTFCNACNLSMVNAFGLAASHAGGVDLIVTGDSRKEQRAYFVWVHRLARQYGLSPVERGGFRSFLEATDNLSQAYFRDIHGDGEPRALQARRVEKGVRPGMSFFSIYDDTAYDAQSHWKLLTECLGFQFDAIAFSFTESDCGNPALMAHLRGLKCERLYGRTYAEGIQEYVAFAVGLMRHKQFPQVLIDEMVGRYADEAGLARMRTLMGAFALDAFGLSEEQLVCMVYSPFAGQGQGLARYLSREQPSLAPYAEELHALLRGGEVPASSLEPQRSLERLSGLWLSQLRTLYQRPLVPACAEGDKGLIGSILERDPHKRTIQTRHAAHGPVVNELLSGR
jgi:3'-phosphoadenosine 5'-phosphosulfate sulfotransferase (PAPS reductase)/FAD synthetase